MNIKNIIKNDLWRWNYILPFVKKHQFDEKGRIDVINKVFHAYLQIHPVKNNNGRRTVGLDTKALLEKVRVDIDVKNQFIYFVDTTKTIAAPGNILSNFTLDYSKIVFGSFNDLVKAAYGDDEYGQEAEAVANGIENLINHVIDSISLSMLSTDIKEKRKDNFKHMLDRPAEHFDEAIQRILFFNQIMWQTRHRLNGLGRLDLLLADLYENDILSNKLTKESAEIMIRDFLLQLRKYSEYKSDALQGDIGQIIILGGLQTDGSYFCNDLTEIFLKIQAKLSFPDPKIFLRVSKNMPDGLLRIAIECLQAKNGSPLFSNDDVIIPSLIEFGVLTEDAYNYCASACWEPFVVGKSLDQNNIAVFDYFAAFDELLNAEDIQKVQSFEELLDAYICINQKHFKEFLKVIDQIKWARDPLVSLFTDGCNEKRTDVSQGAAKYNNYGITTVAISNVVDSLLQIKKIVFDNAQYTLTELNQFRVKNYRENPTLYTYLQKSERYYGHDDDRIIELVNKITDSMSVVAKKYRNRFGGTVKFGLSSPGYNILSKKTAADVAGRKEGMPYNTHISCVDAPYTEVVGFASHLKYDKHRFNGNVIDYFIAPDFLKQNLEKFVLFMKGAIKAGFFQMQMNVLDSETLIDAKRNPQKYAGLIVRVWGFSAYFNDLPESYKDLLIERALNAEKQHIL